MSGASDEHRSIIFQETRPQPVDRKERLAEKELESLSPKD
jgi:hypothetical protein